VASGKEKAATKGVGAQSCAQFGKDRQKSPERWELLYFAWAEGYMSGLNTALIFQYGTDKNDMSTDLGKWSVDKQEVSIRSYCAEHPLKDYREAVEALFSDMRKDQKLEDWKRGLLR
jgi:hypothetical protein